MKKLIFAVMVCGSMLAFGQDAAQPAPDAAKADKKVAMQAKSLGLTVDEYKKLSPEEIKVKNAERKAEREAKQLGISVDEYKKLSREELKSKRAEARAKANEARAKAKAEREAKRAAAKAAKGPESK